MSGLARRFAPPLLPLFTALLLPLGCDDDSDAPEDPLAGEDIVRCELPDDGACIEYQRALSGPVKAFVVLQEARKVCAGGWSGDGTRPGTFGAGSCATEGALARCSISRDYLEVHYYYPGFADSETLDDPLPPLISLCTQSRGTLKAPPF